MLRDVLHPVVSHLAFCVTPYRESDGKRLPGVPDQCPYRHEDPERACRVVLDHLRNRSTGPCIPLRVCRCRGHVRGYTLYPPGFGPYARSPLAPVTLEGKPVRMALERPGAKAPEAPAGGSPKGFSSTYFQAAIDAAEAVFWPREAGEKPGYGEGRYPTQIRQIDRAAAGLGLDRGMGDADRLRISRCLGRALIEGEGVASRIGKPEPVNQERARRICRVLGGLGEAWRAVKVLTHAFYLAGIWGLPSFWDSRSRASRTGSFRRPGTGGSR